MRTRRWKQVRAPSAVTSHEDLAPYIIRPPPPSASIHPSIHLSVRVAQVIRLHRQHSAAYLTVYNVRLPAIVIMSYADVAASGPKQSPQEAAAPQPPEVVPKESASTASLIDVDVPSVHTVPSDFLEQDVVTETQADRVDREAAASKAKAERAKKDRANKAHRADSWLTSQFSKLSDGDASALALANVAAVIGISSWLGYRAWGLYEKGSLDWKRAGVGLGILAGVGAVESLLGGYLYKGKKKGSP
ncbi:hypothetical protein TOPH_08269 [Tolypocladium ophioglossoides CBS 100239]|uniref:Mitochondrial outer membrane protein OM14 C-terminal domain-containing protein n=1 Tax=Tolypocladium ophioglossoides (strain CBS 100239) TaxID=1163406 RepID=A0A0L0MZ90_TOLOC|nr:hypothetical protein TOPH_08269 [Tolypocladium ophioglossoides CBS 100239]